MMKWFPLQRSLKELMIKGKNYLPRSCRYLFIVYHHLQHRMKRQSKVNVNNWIDFWFKGGERHPTPKKQVKKGLHPKRSQNPSGHILDRGPWKDTEHAALFDLQVPEDLKKEIHLAAFLLAGFVYLFFLLKTWVAFILILLRFLVSWLVVKFLALPFLF